jgi:hypothetical protein
LTSAWNPMVCLFSAIFTSIVLYGTSEWPTWGRSGQIQDPATFQKYNLVVDKD